MITPMITPRDGVEGGQHARVQADPGARPRPSTTPPRACTNMRIRPRPERRPGCAAVLISRRVPQQDEFVCTNPALGNLRDAGLVRRPEPRTEGGLWDM